MRTATLLLTIGLLLLAVPVAVPSAEASVCTSNLDLARACVNGVTDCPVWVKFGGAWFCLG
jgi:hypothetical protein